MACPSAGAASPLSAPPEPPLAPDPPLAPALESPAPPAAPPLPVLTADVELHPLALDTMANASTSIARARDTDDPNGILCRAVELHGTVAAARGFLSRVATGTTIWSGGSTPALCYAILSIVLPWCWVGESGTP